MMRVFDATKPIYEALDIAMNYFRCRGVAEAGLKQMLADRICKLFNEGETRPLVLANLAIEMVERQIEVEAELRNSALQAFYLKNS